MVKKTNVQVSEDSDIEHPTSNVEWENTNFRHFSGFAGLGFRLDIATAFRKCVMSFYS